MIPYSLTLISHQNRSSCMHQDEKKRIIPLLTEYAEAAFKYVDKQL